VITIAQEGDDDWLRADVDVEFDIREADQSIVLSIPGAVLTGGVYELERELRRFGQPDLMLPTVTDRGAAVTHTASFVNSSRECSLEVTASSATFKVGYPNRPPPIECEVVMTAPGDPGRYKPASVVFKHTLLQFDNDFTVTSDVPDAVQTGESLRVILSVRSLNNPSSEYWGDSNSKPPNCVADFGNPMTLEWNPETFLGEMEWNIEFGEQASECEVNFFFIPGDNTYAGGRASFTITVKALP
jgi:hypothetical protein